MFDYIPGRAAAPVAPPRPDTSLPRAVFPWLAARLAVRRRDDLPVSDAGLRADLALGFAAQVGPEAVIPEAAFEGGGGQRLHLLVRREGPDGPVALMAQYPRRGAPNQPAPAARQFGELLRDAVRLQRAYGTAGLPLQMLLCTDEFRTFLSALRPPLRLLRADAAGTDVHADLPLAALDDAARNRLADLLDPSATTLRLEVEVLGYAPVGPLHLAMWRVAKASAEC